MKLGGMGCGITSDIDLNGALCEQTIALVAAGKCTKQYFNTQKFKVVPA
jgi:hypothetical protein